jgi:hypothetical protein
MVDPLIHPSLLVTYLVVVGLLLVVPSARRWARRRRERAELRLAVVKRLAPEEEAGGSLAVSRARNRLEVLIPCRIREARYGATRRGFLCGSRGDLAVLADGQVVSGGGYGSWHRLAVSDTDLGGSFEVALEGQDGALVIKVGRADDLVRLVNLAVNHSLEVGYLRA